MVQFFFEDVPKLLNQMHNDLRVNGAATVAQIAEELAVGNTGRSAMPLLAKTAIGAGGYPTVSYLLGTLAVAYPTVPARYGVAQTRDGRRVGIPEYDGRHL